MTHAATNYVGPLTFHALSGHPVGKGGTEEQPEEIYKHLSLAQGGDVVVVAPCTANVLAKIACGLSDDLLTATVLAAQVPIVIAPAMNTNMWTNSATQENVARLQQRGVHVLEVDEGALACGALGEGRLCSLEKIISSVESKLHATILSRP